MKTQLLKLLSGSALFAVLVAIPLRANLTASVANFPMLDSSGKEVALAMASEVYGCSFGVQDALGDAMLLQNKMVPALIAYGNAMLCQPNNAHYRFKYGSVMLRLGFIQGMHPIEDAAKLEPNNPFYAAENARLRALLQQSPSLAPHW